MVFLYAFNWFGAGSSPWRRDPGISDICARIRELLMTGDSLVSDDRRFPGRGWRGSGIYVYPPGSPAAVLPVLV